MNLFTLTLSQERAKSKFLTSKVDGNVPALLGRFSLGAFALNRLRKPPNDDLSYLTTTPLYFYLFTII